MPEPTRILLTGATGFLGSHLLKRLLAEGHTVAVLKRSFSNTWRIQACLDRVRWYDVDRVPLETVVAENDFRIILHCATNYGRREEDPLAIMESNLILPLKLLELGRKKSVPIFINTDTLLDKRVNSYSLSKRQFKDWLSHYARDMVCINIALEHFYGPLDDGSKFVSFIVRNILAGAERIALTEGRQKRDFIFIADVVDAFLTILRDAPGRTPGFYPFEIGTGSLIEIRELVTLIKTLAGNTATRLDFGGLPYRENEIMEVQVDERKIRALGWSPRVGLRDGLIRTLEAERQGGAA
jgi:nucleoside-diphosphate-sugar epimerase